MPSSEVILGSVAGITNQYRFVAIAWHACLGAFLLALASGWRPTYRTAGCFLIAPIASVGVFAGISGNPFNAVVFAVLATVLGAITRRLPREAVVIAPSSLLLAGAVLVGFAWVYPHFLETDRWIAYAYAAPLGLIPCPTLSALIGMTMVLGFVRSKSWSGTAGVMGVTYGAIGVFRLGVVIDYTLLAGAVVLLGAVVRSSFMGRTPRAEPQVVPGKATCSHHGKEAA